MKKQKRESKEVYYQVLRGLKFYHEHMMGAFSSFYWGRCEAAGSSHCPAIMVADECRDAIQEAMDLISVRSYRYKTDGGRAEILESYARTLRWLIQSLATRLSNDSNDIYLNALREGLRLLEIKLVRVRMEKNVQKIGLPLGRVSMFKKLMKENGVTQCALAKKLGVHQTLISQWCHGKSKPSIYQVPKIAETMGVTSDEVIRCFSK